MEEIQIALASDANYFPGLLVTSVSLAQHASRDVALVFNVLDGGMSNEVWTYFTDTVRRAHATSIFHRIPIDDSCFDAYPAWSGTGRMTYARLLLPRVLEDVSHVIYCDVDFLWCVDVAVLWEERKDTVLAQTTWEGEMSTRRMEEPWFAARQLPYSFERYFCAGLMLFNLDLCRRLHVFDRVRAFLDAHPDVQVVDQTALNAVLGAEPLGEGVINLRLLPGRWQVFSGKVTQELLREGCVIHYAGAAPWRLSHRRVLLSDTLMLWHRLNAEIRGGTVWQSLRSFFPIRCIIQRRLLFLMLATPIIRELCWFGFWLSRHKACIKTYRSECRRLSW